MLANKFFFIGTLFSDYVELYKRFERLKESRIQGNLDYPMLKKDTDQPRTMYETGGSFYRMKEMAHDARKSEDLDGLESSLVWIIEIACSDVFHELTRIREALYQRYRNDTEMDKLRSCLQDEDNKHYNEEIRESLETILRIDENAESQIDGTLENIQTLIEIPKPNFKNLLKMERDNHFIKRALYVNMDGIKQVYGEDELYDMLYDFYGTDVEGFSLIYRESLLRKGFYEDAMKVNNSLPEWKQMRLDKDTYYPTST
ncbi:MAG: hypothetical protein ACLFNK_02615 [Candidatus Woesearchaeota archaeon]